MKELKDIPMPELLEDLFEAGEDYGKCLVAIKIGYVPINKSTVPFQERIRENLKHREIIIEEIINRTNSKS